VGFLEVVVGDSREEMVLDVEVEPSQEEITDTALELVISSAGQLFNQEIPDFLSSKPGLPHVVALCDNCKVHARHGQS
jgi:hypothetical protein